MISMRIMKHGLRRAMAKPALTPTHVVASGRGRISQGNHPRPIAGN
jgi:hypothetical protein